MNTKEGIVSDSAHLAPTLLRQNSTDSLLTNSSAISPDKKLIKSGEDLLVVVSMALVYFVGQCAFAMITPFYPLQAKTKGCNGTVVGIVFSVYPVVEFVFSPIAGKLLPRVGPKTCLVGGCFIEGLSEILFGFADRFPAGAPFITYSIIIRFVTALGATFSMTSIIAIVGVKFRENLSTMYGVLELFNGLGLMAGPAVGGMLYQAGGFQLPFFVIGSCGLLLTICTLLTLPSNEDLKQSEGSDGKEGKKSMMNAFSQPGVLVIVSFLVVLGTALAFLDPTLTNHLEDVTNNNISIMKVGFVFLLGSLVYVISAPIVGYVTDKTNAGRKIMIIGSLVGFTGFLLLGPSPLIQFLVPSKLWVILLALSLMGLGFGLAHPPMIADMKYTLLEAGFPDDFTTSSMISGIYGGSIGVGTILGPTLGGVATEYLSFPWTSTIIASLLLFEFVALSVFTIWTKKMSKEGKKDEVGYEQLSEEKETDDGEK